MNKNEFIENLKLINIDINYEQIEKLEKYFELLIEYNKVMNLTGIVSEKDVYLKHFYDSLTVNKVINLNKINNLCDIGTGAGFPGLVIAILFPNIKVSLVDSLNKRIEFLNVVVSKLKLENVKTYHDRIEDFSKKHINKFDVVTSRAVSKLNILLEISVNMIKIDGYFIALKSDIEEELKKSENSINILKCKLINIEKFKLPIENSNRSIVKIQKKENTPSIYPRKFDKIKKNPL